MTVTTAFANLPALDELRFGLPNICGWEAEIASVMQDDQPVFLPITTIDFDRVSAGFACAAFHA